ncbi:DUF2294 domain-containing protein [Lyngbya sp. CCY1209]|uniref:DUF2294 domain-containing protein n=1 Tax=Lyngbya sp. CCY1209 TaxID=2886103 RepID=UPI002D2155E3|nr:DUF2294 domain-containing protein [Lyngbya sp. CCY1209]MEB3884619.1 DUF2294 domain-containing protein [Lyngbya sp. CCY1209]
MTESRNLTRGQMERKLSQDIQKLYRQELGHQPQKIDCDISNDRICIVVEESLTQPENLLKNSGQKDLSREIRSKLDEAIQPQLKQLIQNELSIKVLDVLMDTELDTGRSGMIFVLESAPQLRPKASS